MKTIEDMIAVMTAYNQGEKIECRKISFGAKWEGTNAPVWDWCNYDYRIKSEPHYRPYANAEECFADVKKHGGWALTEQGDFVNVTMIGDNDVYAFDLYTFDDFLKCIWADDGSPCGVKEE